MYEINILYMKTAQVYLMDIKLLISGKTYLISIISRTLKTELISHSVDLSICIYYNSKLVGIDF